MTADHDFHPPSKNGGAIAGQRLTPFPAANKRKTGLWLLVGLAAVAGAVWHGSRRVSTGTAEGGRIDPPGPARAAASAFRIGTFNIHAGRGTDGRSDLERIAKSLQGLSLVGLNEVGGRWPWQHADQAAILGRLTGQAHLFAPFERRWYCFEFGNGLISNMPVVAWQRTPLSHGSDRPRNVLSATLESGRQTLRVVLTHAARRDPEQRDAEIKQVVHLFLATPEPVVLLGDLNAGPDHPLLSRLTSTPGVVDALAGGDGVPDKRIDWILLRGLRRLRSGMVDQGASDHPLFWAEVELVPGVQ